MPLDRPATKAQGQVLALFALILVALLAASALAIDYGGWLVARRNFQNVSDAAALAGAAQLSNSAIVTACGAISGKEQCARQAAWDYLNKSLSLGLTNAEVIARGASIGSTAFASSNGYRIWVASPPSDAGSKYPGAVSNPRTVFVWVEQTEKANIGSIVHPAGTVVSAWATAGVISSNYAFIGLCYPGAAYSIPSDCHHGSGQDVTVNGTGSLLVLRSGDFAVNTWLKTAGSSAALALSTDGSAYMGDYRTCWAAAGGQCNIVSWIDPPGTTGAQRNATPAGPFLVNPGYVGPAHTTATTPYQCYIYSSAPAVSSLDPMVATAPVDVSADAQPVSAQRPPPTDRVDVAAGFTISGKVKNYWTGSGINGLTVTYATVGSNTTSGSGPNAGGYSISGGVKNTNYNVSIFSGATLIWGPTVVNSGANGAIGDILLQPYANMDGYVRSSVTGTGISGATVTIAQEGASHLAPSHTTTTDSTGHYSFINVEAFDRTVTASASSYDPLTKTITVAILTGATSPATDFSLSFGGTIQGTVTDLTTNLPLPNATVTATATGFTTRTTTTNSSGSYTFSGMSSTTWTLTATRSAYVSGAWTTSSANQAISTGQTKTVNLNLWPVNCAHGNTPGTGYGNWGCSINGGSCPAVANPAGGNVSCGTSAFPNSNYLETNAIRPGTYNNITIDNNTCAWIDPQGNPTGLNLNQEAGVVYVKGNLSIGSNAFLFGDGVSIVLDPGATVNVNNSGGFVLNYGTKYVSPTCDLTTRAAVGDTKCYRHVPGGGNYDGQNYELGAWAVDPVTKVESATWTACSTLPCFPTYSTGSLPANPLGETWYLSGSPSPLTSQRFNLSGLMGFLFGGMLYGPNDSIAIGGQGAQASAGQIIGWTITYGGGTTIYHDYHGPQVDGPPYLIEPLLGQ